MDIWNEIQTTIFCIDQLTLDEIFDINSIEDSLDHELEELEVALDRLLENEKYLAALKLTQ